MFIVFILSLFLSFFDMCGMEPPKRPRTRKMTSKNSRKKQHTLKNEKNHEDDVPTASGISEDPTAELRKDDTPPLSDIYQAITDNHDYRLQNLLTTLDKQHHALLIKNSMFPYSSLVIAIQENSLFAARVLLEYAQVHDLKNLLLHTDHNGKTVLHHAAQQCNHAALRLLLASPLLDANEKKAWVNHANNFAQTALHYAAAFPAEVPIIMRNHALQCIILLLQHGADATRQDNLLRTPLHNAAQIGNVATVKVLLQEIAQPGKTLKVADSERHTPGDLAPENSDCLQLLKDHLRRFNGKKAQANPHLAPGD